MLLRHPVALLALALGAGSPARADEPLIYQGDPATAVAQVSADAGRPPWELDPLRPVDLVHGDEVMLLGALLPCPEASRTDSTALRTGVDRARQRMLRQDWTGARAELEQARVALGCLLDEADAEQATYLHLMAGVVAFELGQPEAARQFFDRAHRFGLEGQEGSSLGWDPRLAAPDRGGTPFEAARQALMEAEPAELWVAPGFDPAHTTLRIDGRTQPLPADGRLLLPAGYHHVQVILGQGDARRVRTFEIQLGSERPAVLVDPAGLGRLHLGEHAVEPAMAVLLRRTVAPEGPAWVFADGASWKLEGQEWSQLPTLDPTALEKRRRQAAALRAAGIGALGLGLAGMGLGLARFSQLREVQGWERTTEMQALRAEEARAWRGLMIGSGLVIAGGSVMLGVGQARLD